MVDPALRLVGTMFPEGLNEVTKYSGRGVEREIVVARNLLAVLAELPGAAPLAEAAAAVSTACDLAKTRLDEFKAVDVRVERNRASEAELGERAYTLYHAVHADLIKLFNNNRRHIDTYFLN